MLNHQSADKFFEHCLTECGLIEAWSQNLTLEQFVSNEKGRAELVKTLHDIKTGADAVYSRGKPNEIGADLSMAEWENRWNAWAASRKAAFYSRAALFLLGEMEHFEYFVQVLQNSHNIVFLSASSDVLQHATKRYLIGPEEDLSRNQLADWWEAQAFSLKLTR